MRSVQSVQCRGFESHPRQLRKSDCLGCAVLLCLVCLFDLACFFLSSLIKICTVGPHPDTSGLCMKKRVVSSSCVLVRTVERGWENPAHSEQSHMTSQHNTSCWSQKSRGTQAIIIATQDRTGYVAVTYERSVSTAGSDAIPRLVVV